MLFAKWISKSTGGPPKVEATSHLSAIILGGTVALRAMYASSHLSTHAYIYNPAGVDILTYARSIPNSTSRIFALWHEHDIVSKCGVFPKMDGKGVICHPGDSYPELHRAPYTDFTRHGIPFSARHVGWQKTFYHNGASSPENPIVVGMAFNRLRPLARGIAKVVDALNRLRRRFGGR